MSYGMGMGMGMMGMRMGGMGMMGMSGMGMMGMSGMGMMGGGGGSRPAPKQEHPPDLTREEHIQLGTNFVSRAEVKRQPLTQITAYLDRQMGLTQSETNEVLRRSGIDPTAGVAEYRDDRRGRGGMSARAGMGDARASSRGANRGDNGDGMRSGGPQGDSNGMGLPGQMPASLAYAAAAAALAPPQPTWKTWVLGPGADEAQRQAHRAHQQQLLQQAYQSAGHVAPSTMVLEGAWGGAMMPPSAPRSWLSGRRLLLVAAVVLWIIRANWGSVRPLLVTILQQVAASCGLELETKSSMKDKKRKSQKKKGSKESIPMTEEDEEAAMQDEVGTLKEQIAALRQQMQSNDAILSGIEEEGDCEDATMNGAGERGDHSSDSESSTTGSDGDDEAMVATSDKKASRKKQSARTPRPANSSKGVKTDDDGGLGGASDSLDIPDTASTQRTEPKISAEKKNKAKKNKKAKKKNQKQKQADVEDGEPLQRRQEDGVSAPEVAETARNILRTPGVNLDGSDEDLITPMNGSKKTTKKKAAGKKKSKKKKKQEAAPTAVVPDPNATPILEDDAEQLQAAQLSFSEGEEDAF